MNKPQPLISRKSGSVSGTLTPPGDKSISHRAVMLGAVAEGTTTIKGLLEGEDVLRTLAAMEALGAKAHKAEDHAWHIHGVGLANLKAPKQKLDMGNSGTAARLLIGLIGARPFTSEFTGDASLCKRPMERIITPLSQMGLQFESEHGRLPLKVTGPDRVKPITYTSPVASAQVKSAVLLAGLSADGITTFIERTPTRDHSENMLRHFGAGVSIDETKEGLAISLKGQPNLKGSAITVPADPSSAAFALVAALLHEGSHFTLKNVGLNPRRAGLIQTLIEMGANIKLTNKRDEGGEPVADLVAEGSQLKGITVSDARAPSMIDEYPILAIAAACAQGTTRMQGLAELRVKESDRLALIADGLKRCGVKVEIERDDLIVHGTGAPPLGGSMVETAMDHRIAMSFLILGSVTRDPVSVDDGSFIATSFPDFTGLMNRAGLKITNS